jgi:site-specific recombinase XerD
MLDTLFPIASKKCLGLPLFGPIMEEFTDWLVQQGYVRLYIRAVLNAVRKMDRYLRRKGVHRIDEITSDSIRSYWQSRRRRGPWQSGPVHIMERFLRKRGLCKSTPPTTPTTLHLAEYSAYLRDVRGLTAGTIYDHVWLAERLLVHLEFDKSDARLAVINSKDIEGFVQKIGKSISRASLQHRISQLRSFLRFLATTDKIATGLADQIDAPRVYRFENLPRTLSWPTVQALLRSIPKATVKGRRDFTMLFLIATYGLRSSEVAALTLDDLDWRASQIRIHQTKTDNTLVLPLTDAAAKVLIAYLRQVPRPSGSRHLFFQVRAPIEPLKRAALRDAFNKWAQRSGLGIPFHGPHCLRNSFAVHLLRQGTSLKTIGDLLGHHHPETTAGYLRLASHELRQVGLSVPRSVGQKGGRA